VAHNGKRCAIKKLLTLTVLDDILRLFILRYTNALID